MEISAVAMAELEKGGYVFCYDCGMWVDDAWCFNPGDHSNHCGHTFKMIGDHGNESYMVIKCDEAAAAKLQIPGVDF